LKILHLPNNIASLPATTSFALNMIPSINSIVYSNTSHHYLSHKDVVSTLKPSFLKNPLKNVYANCWQFITLLKLIYNADVLHWYCNMIEPSFFWIWYIKTLKKPGVIEWMGSDIRDPKYLMQINPYYKEVFINGNYEYKNTESKD
jgi:hypothetical protein